MERLHYDWSDPKTVVLRSQLDRWAAHSPDMTRSAEGEI
jgi:hypothetical protein